MKKFALALIASILMAVNAYAGTSVGKSEPMFDAVVLNGTGTTVTSRTFNVASVSNMGYYLDINKGASNGGVNIRLTMEVSPNGSLWATHSTIRQSWNSIVATAGTIDVPAMSKVRFVAEGATGNATDSTVTAYLFTQE